MKLENPGYRLNQRRVKGTICGSFEWKIRLQLIQAFRYDTGISAVLRKVRGLLLAHIVECGSDVPCPGHWEYNIRMRCIALWTGGEGASRFSKGRETASALLTFWKKRRKCGVWGSARTAWCLLNYHLLVQTPDANLSQCVRHLSGVYTQRFNKSHPTDSQLLRGRYKSILLEAESYLLELVRYIHRNPLKTGVVDRLYKYPWSSHKGYLSVAKKWDWLYKDFVLSLFSNDKADRIKEEVCGAEGATKK